MMVNRKNLIGLAVAGIALTTTIAFAQAPPPAGGMPAPGPATAGAAGGVGGMPAATTDTTVTTTNDPNAPAHLPKTGGDPLTMTVAGSFLLTAGYAVRRKLRGN